MDQREVVCPTGKDEALSAQERLGCGNDSYGDSQYICLPNKEKTQLVEICFGGIMGMNEKGILLDLINVLNYYVWFYIFVLLYTALRKLYNTR